MHAAPYRREPVEVRQPDVEQDEIDGWRVQGSLSCRSAGDDEALGTQAFDERLGDRVFVFDNEEVHDVIVRASPSSRTAGWLFLAKSLPQPGSPLAGRVLPSERNSQTEVIAMNRRRAAILTLACAAAALAGVFALGRSLSLGSKAGTATDAQISLRSAQLDRYEASLVKALSKRPPPLPRLPKLGAANAARSAPTTRVVYRRPPPVVVRTASRDDGEYEFEHEGEYDDD